MNLSPIAAMNVKRAGLSAIADKVIAGERLSFDDGMRLVHEPDLAAIGALANLVRERLHGDWTWFNRNLHVNATNVCEASCIFCSFARLETGDPNAWTMSFEDALGRIRVLDDALVRGEQGGRALGLLKSVAGGDVSADPLPDEAVGALGARGEVDVGDDCRLLGGERDRGEEEESGVGDARHGGARCEKWRRGHAPSDTF